MTTTDNNHDDDVDDRNNNNNNSLKNNNLKSFKVGDKDPLYLFGLNRLKFLQFLDKLH